MNNLNELQINYDNLLKLGYAVLDIRFKDYDFCPDRSMILASAISKEQRRPGRSYSACVYSA